MYSRTTPELQSNLLHYQQYDVADEFNLENLPEAIDGYIYFPVV